MNTNHTDNKINAPKACQTQKLESKQGANQKQLVIGKRDHRLRCNIQEQGGGMTSEVGARRQSNIRG